MGLVVLPLIVLAALIHGVFGEYGMRHLFKGFGLARTRWDVLSVALIAALTFACTMATWGWGTTLFKREVLAITVGFGYLFAFPALLFFFLPPAFSRLGPRVVHGMKAGIGLAIPMETMYYMIYMFYIVH